MRFLADEHFPSASLARLRSAGHDVAAVAEGAGGNPDPENIALAIRERRVILTYDRDYGEPIFERGAPSPPGVTSFRRRTASSEEPAEHALRLLAESKDAIRGLFVAVGQTRDRRRPLS